MAAFDTKTTPVNADTLVIFDSADNFTPKVTTVGAVRGTPKTIGIFQFFGRSTAGQIDLPATGYAGANLPSVTTSDTLLQVILGSANGGNYMFAAGDYTSRFQLSSNGQIEQLSSAGNLNTIAFWAIIQQG